MAEDHLLDEFNAEVEMHYRRNFTAGLVHGVFLQASAAFVGTYTVLPAFVSSLTPSTTVVGLVAVIISLGGILPEFFTAYLVEGRPRMKIYLLGVITVRWISWLALAWLTFQYGVSQPGLVLGAFFTLLTLFSLAGGMGTVVYADIFARAIPAERRGRFAGIKNLFGYALAIAVGMVVKAILQDEVRFPFPSNYALLFLLSGLVLSIAFIGFAMIREPIYPVQRRMKSLRAMVPRSIELVRTAPNFRRLLVVQGLQLVGLALAPFYVVYARQELHTGPELVGVFISAQMIGAALSNLLWGWIGDRFGNRRVIIGVALVGALVPLAALAIPASLAFLYAGVFVLLGVTLSGIYLGYGNILLEMAPVEVRPTCVALRDTLLAPVALLPLVAGVLIEHLPYNWVFGAGAVLMGIGFILALKLLDPRYHPDDAMCKVV